MRRYVVTADIRYLEGNLAGLTIPAGHRVTFPRRKIADRHARWLASVRDADDFIRAAISGWPYKVIGAVEVTPLDTPKVVKGVLL